MYNNNNAGDDDRNASALPHSPSLRSNSNNHQRPISPSNQVRINAARVVYSRWRVVFFWSTIVVNFIQLVISITALIASLGKSCDSPLRTFLVLYTILIATNITICVYQYRHADVLTASSTRSARLIKSVSESTDFLTVVSYLLGNIWLSGSKTCSATAPALYFTALAWVIWGYCLLLLPIVALACIIMCLPCFIIFFNVFHLGSPQSSRQGANEEQIGQIPCIPYKQDGGSGVAEEDAKCSICLAEYQAGEPLRRLGCLHHFHKGCVDQWLVISATCPLCVQPITSNATASLREQV